MLVKVLRHSLLVYLLLRLSGCSCQELLEGSIRYGPLGIQVAFEPKKGPISWFYVAEMMFGLDEAALACRGLSNSLLVSYTYNQYETSELVEVRCGTSDDLLEDCHFDDRRTDRYINVTCLQETVGNGAVAGQLEDNRVLIRVLQRERLVWGHVCADDMNQGFDYVSADLFCNDLGYGRAREGEMASLYLASGNIIVVEFTSCDGTDVFNKCSTSVVSDRGISCQDNSVISVQCERERVLPTTVSEENNIINTTPSPTSQISDTTNTDPVTANTDPVTANTDPVTYSATTDPVTYSATTDPVTYSANTDPVMYSANTDPVTYSANTDSVTYSANTDPVTYATTIESFADTMEPQQFTDTITTIATGSATNKGTALPIPTGIVFLDLFKNKWFIIGAILSATCVWVLLLIGLVCICLCFKKIRKKVTVVNAQYLTEAEMAGAFSRVENSNYYNSPETVFSNTVELTRENPMHNVIFRTLRYDLGEEVSSETVYQIPDDSYYDTLLYGLGSIVPSADERISNNFRAVDSWDENGFSGYISQNTILPCFADKNSLEFWTPHDTIKGIFDQMSRRQFREISIGELTRDKKVGEGNFGYVYRGMWKSPSGGVPVPVAIKSIKCQEEGANFLFLKEAVIMGQFDHVNVLKLLGVVTLSHPIIMVTELMYIGLKQFLEDAANSGSVKYDLFAPLFLNFSLDIASGMQHLSSKLYVHRDLAARNILLSHTLSCKIGDFGLTRRARIEDEYYLSSGGVIPYKWTAPEGICYNKYSEKSDVWSYGITLFEIWSVGGEPWKNLLPEEAS